ncbi:iron transporter [Polymorphobacter glacialis]|uniref:Iron transporter n=1 Tax=Sandarakinorhabdus glacialis TaxID=1614636 RepID=A0A916ZNJ2_9SPHN|nr:divalent metal cation transporter [Polymorphobacter glacialis]GGE06409.1 iron transporter [Polymorphobacter glacialis]
MKKPPAPDPAAASTTVPPRRFNPFAALGPGLVTGAADDDPSGIATYSQAGARFGFGMLWTIVLTYPFMAVFQLICASIARVSGYGLAANMKRSFPIGVARSVVTLLLIANVLNIAADIAAMGVAAEMVTGLPHHGLTIGFALLSLLLQLFVPYHRYVSLLKWLTLSLFAYVGVVLLVSVPWARVASAIVWPQMPMTAAAATMVVAIFGTTISPYLFFWQAAQELEDSNARKQRPLRRDHKHAAGEFRRLAIDTWGGMAFSNIIALAIMISTAVTLNAAGITNIATAADAAEALRPIAGEFAFALFAIGIIATGMLAVPVLAGSGAYALSEVMGWQTGLALRPRAARNFYGIITLAIVAATALDFLRIDPMLALFWSAIVNGVVAVPVMTVIMLLAGRRSVMGAYTVKGWHRAIGWAATALMALASVIMFATL